MINILHVINGWPPGGIAEQTYLICKHLPKDKFKQYSIGYCHFDGYFVKKFEEIGVKCIKSDQNYSNLQNIIKDKNIHIIHKQTGGGDCPKYSSYIKSLGCKFIETLHCPRASGIPYYLIDKIIYTTEYTLYKNHGSYHPKMQSIKYALDLMSPIVEKAKEEDKENIVVGRLGRVVPDKRGDVLLELSDLCYKDFGDKIQFRIAGQIPQDYQLHIEYGEWFKYETEKRSNIKYVGFVDNKYDFWKTLDICINPVEEASFDVVFLEAMACGAPILTWDNSCAKYVVSNAGLITKPTVKDMYDGLKKLYFDYGLRNVLGNIGIKYIKERYSLNNFINSYTKLYEGLINENINY